MIKSVNIDGKHYIIRECGDCPMGSWEDDGLHCQYPVAPHEGFFGNYKEFPEDCPLGLTKDCFTCKHEGHKDDGTGPCNHCMISFDSVTGEQSDPSMWEVKE